jgi:hypothetical protein
MTSADDGVASNSRKTYPTLALIHSLTIPVLAVSPPPEEALYIFGNLRRSASRPFRRKDANSPH